MMKVDFSKRSSIPSVFDSETNQLHVPSDVTIDEIGTRFLKDMRTLFLDADGYEDDLPLYFMYNGIYREKHKDFFKSHNMKYEYTVLLDTLINGEFIKAHGHIHGFNEVKKARHIEAYEILSGEGYFELFKYEGDVLQVVMIKTKPGDYFIVPSDYYHLSINTGNEPFIFGDLIIEGANNDYSHLKEKNGAPLYALKNSDGQVVFRENTAYKDSVIEIIHTTVDELPWDNSVDPIPLYAHFITNPEKFDYLK